MGVIIVKLIVVRQKSYRKRAVMSLCYNVDEVKFNTKVYRSITIIW